ncbi:MAG: MucBP domain-containing protein, partial [Firmicutes bacterium]|nr:MucBP domain-containing protein [Bacillota bacterium]
EDNSKYMTGEQIIKRDIDYVVVYGMKSTMVEYTVHYVDANGDPLAEPQTFYGNIGDKPVVAFRYFENYQPQAYNLTKTLSEDASENVFTFEYPETVPETLVIVVPGQPGGGQQDGQQQGGQGGQQEGQGGQQGGQDGGQQGGQDGGQQGGQGDNPEPVDIIDIDPPLAPGDKGLPAWAWVGIGAAALGVIAIPIILIVKRRRDDDDEDDDE